MSKFGFDFEDHDGDMDNWNDFDEMFYQMTMKGLDDDIDIEDEFDPECYESIDWEKEML